MNKRKSLKALALVSLSSTMILNGVGPSIVLASEYHSVSQAKEDENWKIELIESSPSELEVQLYDKLENHSDEQLLIKRTLNKNQVIEGVYPFESRLVVRINDLEEQEFFTDQYGRFEITLEDLEELNELTISFYKVEESEEQELEIEPNSSVMLKLTEEIQLVDEDQELPNDITSDLPSDVIPDMQESNTEDETELNDSEEVTTPEGEEFESEPEVENQDVPERDIEEKRESENEEVVEDEEELNESKTDLEETVEDSENNLEETVIEPETNLEKQELVEEEVVDSIAPEVFPFGPQLNFRVFTSSSISQKEATMYYYIYSGDTLNSIASRYNTTVDALKSWNQLMSNEIKVGQLISVNGVNSYKKLNKENRTFANNAEFVSFVGKAAGDLSAKNDIYASVMTAQAVLESNYGKSALSRLGNNLFGVKSYNTNEPQIIINTTEYVNNKPVTVKASFKFYPSYSESLQDNANKLKNGVSWDRSFYTGALVKNTNWYKDATLFLTQRYATDTAYYSKLNNIIQTFNLTQYDRVGNTQTQTEYRGMFTGKTNPIGNLPFNLVPASNANIKNIVKIGDSKTFIGREVKVLQKTMDGKYLHIQYKDDSGQTTVTRNGWVSPESISKINFGTKEVKYNSIVANSGYSIDTLPWGQSGASKVGSSRDYVDKTVQVVSETTDGGYVYITQNGNGIGWVDARALTAYKVKNVNYTSIVSAPNYDVGNSPWGVKDYKKLSATRTYFGSEVTIKAETLDGAYKLATIDNQEIGWIDARAFGLVEENYAAVISSPSFDVSNLAWGANGYKRIGLTRDHQGILLQIKGQTKDGAYALVYKNDQRVGWVDTRAIKSLDIKETNQSAYMINRAYNIDSLPWGTPGFKTVGKTTDWTGKKVTIKAYANSTSYALIFDGNKEIGWVDVRALSTRPLKNVQYEEYISTGRYEINSLPWGMPGYTKIGMTSNYINQKVVVTQLTEDQSYALVSKNGKEIGWVDIRSLGFKQTNEQVVINSGRYNVDTLPWGTPGYKTVGLTSAYTGNVLTIKARTENGYYLLLEDQNKEIGWVDERAVSTLSTKAVNNIDYIASGGYEINTLPWGTPGYKKTGMTADYLNQKVTITSVTTNGAYALATIDGKEIGWVDSRAIGYTNVNRTVTIKKGQYNIDTLPWGTPGFQTVGYTKAWLNKTVTIKAETRNGHYALIYDGNKEIGWVDVRTFE